MRRHDDFLIVGGGLIGCAIAMNLARAGKRVTVLEKNVCGRHASSVNAGGLRMLMRDPAEYPLSLRAMEIWENLADFVGSEPARGAEFIGGVGQISLAFDQNEMQACAKRHDEMRALDLGDEELLDREEVRKLLPEVAPHIQGGLISRRDGHGNPARAALAFRRAAEAAGARIIEGVRVEGLAPVGNGWRVETARDSYEAGMVVNCGGAWGGDLAAKLGEHLPMLVLALSMMVTARVTPFIKPVVIGVNRPLSFKQSAAGALVIGGGMLGVPRPEADTSYTVMDRMGASAAAVIEAFPILREVQILRTWSGLEGRTPDAIPYIGPSQRNPGIWHAFGFCGHGFQISPAIGEVVARSLIAGRVDPLLAPFDPARGEKAAA